MEDLLKKAKDGDKAAFETFYNENKRRILNYVYRMVGNLESAEEITQEVFVKAYFNLSRYIPMEKPLNWIYTIAGNLCKNFLRDNRQRPQVSLDKELAMQEGLTLKDMLSTETRGPSDLAMGKELTGIIQAHIDRLPAAYKEALVLCDIQGCSYEEAAGILKCKIGSVASRLHRARLILAKALRGYFK